MKKSVAKKYFNISNLKLAWERYLRSNKITKDYYGINTFGLNLNENLNNLNKILITGKYIPTRPQKIYIPKSSKAQRTITILDIEDAIIYQAIANIIAQKAYDILNENSEFIFGSVLCEEVKEGIKIIRKKDSNLFFFKQYLPLYKKFVDSVNRAIQEDKVTYKFETDITGFFDSISHYNLLDILHKRFKIEDDILNMLSVCLNYWSGTRDNLTPGVGIPQSCTPSFFFANVLLYDLDNLIKRSGHSYYRYMDDIRIYGYDEYELTKSLVTIDQYLKSIALSINSKKTSIESIKEEERGELIINFDVSINEEYEMPDNEDISKDFSIMAEQDGIEESDKNNGVYKTLTNSTSIINFWIQEINNCKIQLNSYFTFNQITSEYEFTKDVKKHERDILNIAYKYRSAFKGLNNFIEYKPDEDILDIWLKLMKIYFWRCDQICWVLNNYKSNNILKQNIFTLIDHFDFYEWMKFHLYTTLNLTQTFTKRELKGIFQKNKNENSFFVKLAVYKLLIYHCQNDNQFFSSIVFEIRNENNIFLKKQLLYDIERKKRNEFSFKYILESLGL